VLFYIFHIAAACHEELEAKAAGMKPGEIEAGILFSNESKQYWVPRYQRRYEWGTDKLHGLWQDLGLMLSGANQGKHFLGIILGSPSNKADGMPSTKVEVIDGQQRITTLLLLLAAIMDHANEQANKKGPTFKNHPLYFLYDRFKKRFTDYRILELQSSDGKELDDVMAGKWRKKYNQPNKSAVLEAYIYFRYCLWIGGTSFTSVDEYILPEAKTQKDKAITTIEALWTKLGAASDPQIASNPLSEAECDKLENVIKTQIVFLNILTEPTDQNAVVIFDSINGKRLEFSQWDYARSYFFRTIGTDNELFDRWDKTQDDLGDALKETGQRKRRGNTPVNDEFLYNFMILEASKSGEKANKNRSFLQLKEHLRKTLNGGNEPTAENLREFSNDVLLPTAEVYKSIISPQKYPLKNPSNEPIPDEAVHILSQIQSFSKGPADPAVMLCLVSWHKGEIDHKELIASLRGIECFLARYFLAGLDFSPLRSKFMQMIGTASQQSAAKVSRPILLLGELKKHLPSNDEILDAHKDRLQPVYSEAAGAAQRVAAILRGIEREISGPAANPMSLGTGATDFNVDHIFPQSCREGLNNAWKDDVKKWALKDHETDQLRKRVDCLGNLALHASYSNKSDQDADFEYKKSALSGALSRKMIKGKKGKKKPSVIVSHAQGVCSCEKWTAKEIDARTVELLEHALEYWSV
jgi:uncharacterized protein with ParB-like and HNH nuclease domain